MSLTLFNGHTGSTKSLIAEAKSESKLTALFTPYGRREVREMDLPTIRHTFGEYAMWFMMNLRQGKIKLVKKS